MNDRQIARRTLLTQAGMGLGAGVGAGLRADFGWVKLGFPGRFG